MGQKVIIGTHVFLLNFVVISLQKKAYDALLGRGWLVATRADVNWKNNTISIENKGRKYIIDLKNQAVNEEATSSDSLYSDSEEEQT